MQGTVSRFHPEDGSGELVTDDGEALNFPGEAFARSGLLRLRPGQRVRFELDPAGGVRMVTIATLPGTG
jgi:cold shock CspA family protein